MNRREIMLGLPLSAMAAPSAAGQNSPILELFARIVAYGDWINEMCGADDDLDHHTAQLLEMEDEIIATEASTLEELAAQWLAVTDLGKLCGGMHGPDPRETLLLQRMMALLGVPE